MLYPMAPGYSYDLIFEVSNRTAGSVTAQIGTTETIGSQVLANADDKFPMPESVDGNPSELRLQLNRAPETNEDKERRQKQKEEQKSSAITKP